ncbi:cyclodeaminase/cyclohydrolase family protein [Sedimentibacter sp.]|uniref:cyclodeaminase/cyclohydrolase family protein n=1 Tax=Sedimentibacter sp. TaxID=1960295 RepID=UPI0028AE7C00|nr:cyclodeaminase/cyclohydrolase family protein [Sedimentibacter sp.]
MRDFTLNDFTEKLASNSPVPGGGSVAAVCGTLSAALAEMVANLTLGKKKYIQFEEEMNSIIEKTTVLRNKLLDYIEKDSNAYNKVMEAYKMAKETEEEKVLRAKAIEEYSKGAAIIPFEIAETAFEIFPLTEAVVKNGNSNAITDGLISAMLARTAVLAGILNVQINLDYITDVDFVTKYKALTDELKAKACEYEKKILNYSPF